MRSVIQTFRRSNVETLKRWNAETFNCLLVPVFKHSGKPTFNYFTHWTNESVDTQTIISLTESIFDASIFHLNNPFMFIVSFYYSDSFYPKTGDKPYRKSGLKSEW